MDTFTYLTAKELRKELNIKIPNWNHHKKKSTFPEPDGYKWIDKNHPEVSTWNLSWFKEWWDNRPIPGRPIIDITNL